MVENEEILSCSRYFPLCYLFSLDVVKSLLLGPAL